ncbi:MAG: glycosyltransferase [Anaerobacillus sp.]
MKKVSIIIPFYNCEYIDIAIESALAQTYSNIEVIVVNDGATSYAKKISPYYHLIRYIEQGNKGTAGALNTGIKAATGDYFTWLSADDVYAVDKVEKQLAYLEKMQAAIGYSSYKLIDHYGHVTNESVGVSFPTRLDFLRHLKRGCAINGCTVMMEMQLLEEFGGFDESLPFTHDYDLWVRIAEKYSFVYMDECLVSYRVHNEMGTKKHAEAIIAELANVRRKHRSMLSYVIRKERMGR